jgi:hypothetical protein
LGSNPPPWRFSDIVPGPIRNWIRQADLDEGRRSDGLTMEELQQLR